MTKIQNIKRLIREEGIVISKEYREAKDERQSFDGKVYPATEEKYILTVVSGEAFSDKTGFTNPLFREYSVNKNVWDAVKYFDKVDVLFELSNFGTKELGIELKKVN